MSSTTLRTEIKAWEHEFREQNSRNPTVDDIKAQPHIADKYKLYKKLTKEANAADGRTKAIQAPASEPPRTPPREGRKRHVSSAAAPTVILPKSRPVASDLDVTNNPFSPVKRKQRNSTAPSSSTNPFLTPLKTKSVRPRTPSPDPFPSISSALAPALAVRHNPAVDKARKRLRGESVSPSPQPREKRRRLPNANAPQPTVDSGLWTVSPAPTPVEEGDSFVDESPVKAPAGGKAFKPLFEEANHRAPVPLSQPGPSNHKNDTKVFSRAKTIPGRMFAGVKKEMDSWEMTKGNVLTGQGTIEVDREVKAVAHTKTKGKGKTEHVVKKKRFLPGPKGLIPGKDDLFGESTQAVASSSSSANSKVPRKRTLSNASENEQTDERATPVNGWYLLPPSPPPEDNSGRYNPKGKNKAKHRAGAKGKTKKAKLAPTESDEDMAEDQSSSESADVKVVTWRGRPRSPRPADGDDTTLELDPELQFHLRSRPVDARTRSAPPRLENFEVDLPEEMRRALAISPGREREKEEEELVKGLLKGARKGGGVVWGPGEVGGEGDESDEASKGPGEDDWEGEGVPWEVAEL